MTQVFSHAFPERRKGSGERGGGFTPPSFGRKTAAIAQNFEFELFKWIPSNSQVLPGKMRFKSGRMLGIWAEI